jgi:site-specific DNA-methyltransferase (adenine-specific)/modification methylase
MNLRIMKGKYRSRQIVKELSTKYEGFNDNLPIDDFYNIHSKILKELLRVSKIVFYNIQIVTGSKRAFFKIMGEFHKNLKEVIIWDKKHGQPAMQQEVLNRRSELLLVFEDEENAISRQFKKCNFGRGTLDDVWEIGRGAKVDGSHGATFPLELVETVLTNFTSPNDLVYDPFSGTGTTAVVCKKMGRDYIGSEMLKNYCEIAENRIKKVI